MLAPALVVAILGGAIAITLLQRPPNILDAPIAPEVSGRPVDAIDLGMTPLPDGTRRAEVGLRLDRPDTLAVHSAVRLLAVTYGTRPSLVRAEIRIEGTDCVFRTRPGAAAVNTGLLEFERGEQCGAPLAGSPTGRLNLVIDFRGPARIGLVADHIDAAAFDPRWWSFSAADPTPGAAVPVIRGRYVDYLAGAPRRRVELLAYMWQGSTSSGWIWVVVGLALVVLFAGMVSLNQDDPDRASVVRGHVRLSLGVGAVALGLALLYVVLVPPLQGPDEPDHVLAFAQAVGRPGLADLTAALARRSHFDRIRFHSYEHFRAADIGRPAAVAWTSEVFAHQVAARSVTTWLWWKMVAPLTASSGAGWTILTLRLANALLFGAAACAAAFLLLVVTSSVSASPHSVCLALLLVPTLPFFATHVSEFAVLTSAYVVLAATLAALCLDTGRSHVLGFPLGLMISLIFASGRSGLPMGPIMVAAVAARALMGNPIEDSSRTAYRNAIVFWAGLALGLGLLPLLSTPEFRGGLEPADASPTLGRARQAAEFLRHHPAIVLLVAPIGLALDRATAWIRRAVPVSLEVTAARLLSVACYVSALAIAGSLVASLALRFPVLPTLELSHPISARAYALSVLRVALTGFRLTNHDHLLSSSFWIGFGWIDTLPGPWMVTFLVGLTSLALVGLLTCLGHSRQWRRAGWIAFLATGWCGALVLYAVASYDLHRSLHGRYLVGFYLSILAVSWCLVGLLPRWRPTGAWGLRVPGRECALVAVAAGLQAYALWFILLRYL